MPLVLFFWIMASMALLGAIGQQDLRIMFGRVHDLPDHAIRGESDHALHNVVLFASVNNNRLIPVGRFLADHPGGKRLKAQVFP